MNNPFNPAYVTDMTTLPATLISASKIDQDFMDEFAPPDACDDVYSCFAMQDAAQVQEDQTLTAGADAGAKAGEAEVNSPYKPRKRPADDAERTPVKARKTLVFGNDGNDIPPLDANQLLQFTPGTMRTIMREIAQSPPFTLDSPTSSSPLPPLPLPPLPPLSDQVRGMPGSLDNGVRLEWTFIQRWTMKHLMREDRVESLIFDVDAAFNNSPDIYVAYLTDVQVRRPAA